MNAETSEFSKSKPRVKAWTPKVKTGCKTCKRRKIKCDESRPSCQRCVKAKLVCDGYDAVQQGWIIENPTGKVRSAPKPEKQQHSLERVDTASTQIPGAPPAADESSPESDNDILCVSCDKPNYDCTCSHGPVIDPASILALTQRSASLGLKPSSIYKTSEEQYYFKYFMEVGAPSVARADISGAFWLNLFPRAAYSSEAIRDSLLSSATIFQSINKSVWLQGRIQKFHPRAVAYENRAIDLLVHESPNVDTILITSCAFWFVAVSAGDWVRSMQHMYHALKIIVGVKDPSKHDQLVLRYTDILARASLLYYRTTRGPCSLHPEASITDCEASCFVPEPTSLEVRVSDALYHLREAKSSLNDCIALLKLRKERHPQHERILELLKKQQREIRFLTRKWSDSEHLGIEPSSFLEAAKLIPVTFSPFRPIHNMMQTFIVQGESGTFTFGELELRMRVLLPNFMTATSQGHPILLTDTVTLMWATTYVEKRRQLSTEPASGVAKKIMSDFLLE